MCVILDMDIYHVRKYLYGTPAMGILLGNNICHMRNYLHKHMQGT